ncbi:MAG: UvrD-helicase domain-containing protein [Thermodesulfovibrionales bacterium]
MKDRIKWCRENFFRIITKGFADANFPLTIYEEILFKHMKSAGLHPIPQYAIRNVYNDPLYDYRLDFAFENEKVYIECDGLHHFHDEEQRRKDMERDLILKDFGWRGIRFLNSEIEKNPSECVKKIKELLESSKLSEEPQRKDTGTTIDNICKKYDIELDEDQKRAVAHGGGPAVVIAGPGAGKTRVIVARVVYLVEKGIDPGTIVVITFTKKAAENLKERLQSKVGDRVRQLIISTIHSFCHNQIIRPYYKIKEKEPPRPLKDKRKWILPIFNKLKTRHNISLDVDGVVKLIEGLQTLSIHKDFRELMSNEEVRKHILKAEDRSLTKTDIEFLEKVYNQYKKLKEANNEIDFEDIIGLSYTFLKENHKFRERIQKDYTHIIVDEYQDTGSYIHELLQVIAAPQDNLYVVGDDDQSIYGFRGVTPKVIVNFDKDYPLAHFYVLNTNYRSKRLIVDYANRLIKHNRNRYPKTIKSYETSEGKVEINRYEDELVEASVIVEKIWRKIHKEGCKPDTDKPPFAILLRARHIAHNFIEELAKKRISFDFPGTKSLDNFYDREGIRHIISYLKIAIFGYNKPCEDEWIGEKTGILNVPNRYIDRSRFLRLLSSGNNFFRDYQLFETGFKESVKRHLRSLKDSLEVIRKEISSGKNMDKIIASIRERFGLDKYFLRHDFFGNDDESIIEDMDLFESKVKAHEFVDLQDLLSHIESFSKAIKEKKSELPFVRIDTIHGAKGLEFEHVFIPMVNDKYLPNRRNSLSEDDIEEERRLLYVAMTRARSELYISFNRYVGLKKSEPSRFLSEIEQWV